MTYTKSFPIRFQPKADLDAVVTEGPARFTLLSPRLIRIEYSPAGHFEDRPSQAFWYRKQPVPGFQVERESGTTTIETDFLFLRYNFETDQGGFSSDNLSISLKENGLTWRFGSQDPDNLLGTARTLDNIDGVQKLEPGLLSRSGFAVYEDSGSLVFNESGWLEPRQAAEGTVDLYFFGHGSDSQACLSDFARVAGPAPMVPRWALGNWWSRYWAYSADELLALMDEFKNHDVPLSVCIVDMDWHLTDTGNASSGWTGYTWNRELFPDPPAFIQALHQRGLKTALNLHPADGVHDHEEQYPEMAAAVGIDPDGKTPVPFDIADPVFTRSYFELLHHPQEKIGVDFWWLDWQQGTLSGLPGLDPLWWINHLHFFDLARDGEKRPFIFSRWGGLGNHRYPIGFSGDTIVSWESLAYQPFFTAAAANVNYGWWSHDIGGHMGGIEEAELFARWIQYGVFSPILRMHCTNNPFHERRPWGWDAETEKAASSALRLRHNLIPYIYTMAWKNHREHIPLVRPIYHDHPESEAAYHCPDQYLFGSELLAAPFVTPMDRETGLARQAVWLPEGNWIGFFDNKVYEGNSWQAVYGNLEDIPVFAKAGAIVPTAGKDPLENPPEMTLHVFPGQSSNFVVYEDDGKNTYSETPVRQSWTGLEWWLEVGPAEGQTSVLPERRKWTVIFHCLRDLPVIEASHPYEAILEPGQAELRLELDWIEIGSGLQIKLTGDAVQSGMLFDHRLSTCQKLVASFRMESWTKQALFGKLQDLIRAPAGLEAYALRLSQAQLRALAETITGAGWHFSSTRSSQDNQLVVWNNAGSEEAIWRLVALDPNGRAENRRAPMPEFGVYTLGNPLVHYREGGEAEKSRMSVLSWFSSLEPQLQALPAGEKTEILQFLIAGEQGGDAYIVLDGQGGRLETGRHSNPDATISAGENDWAQMINGRKTPDTLFREGKIEINGNQTIVMRMAQVLRFSPPNMYQAKNMELEVSYFSFLRFNALQEPGAK